MLSKEAYAHMKQPHGAEVLPQPDLVGTSGQEGQGPFYVINLKVTDGRIAAAAFRTYGCPWANAIGSALTKRLEGKTFEEASRITGEDINADLGGVPRDKTHLLSRIFEALRAALAQGAAGAA